ncbi:PIN domain-containing protein [Thiothrix winogradskyi]|uniref:PIN domain-containing protein n=1 Tax=Thiothrix winogradskyi TaxID=96472 RepID=A0ABY3SW15_9GAMM|nr:PIN domain-containing protein [Thiothrix winogradskyi]UJS22680.1 PIN domain-containing protein [Thiothrix winogradskyi]
MCISAVTDMEIAYEVRNKRELQQHQKLLADALIAATAQRHNLTLFTFNLKDFRFLGISLDTV